jgi:hypothetical protein
MEANPGAPGAGKLFLSHVRTCATEAVCLLMIDALSFETLMTIILRRCFVGVDDLRRNAGADDKAAWLSDTAGTELPPRSRITTTTLRLPFWFPAETTVNAIL